MPRRGRRGEATGDDRAPRSIPGAQPPAGRRPARIHLSSARYGMRAHAHREDRRPRGCRRVLRQSTRGRPDSKKLQSAALPQLLRVVEEQVDQVPAIYPGAHRPDREIPQRTFVQSPAACPPDEQRRREPDARRREEIRRLEASGPIRSGGMTKYGIHSQFILLAGQTRATCVEIQFFFASLHSASASGRGRTGHFCFCCVDSPGLVK